jgi:hypothetical protein
MNYCLMYSPDSFSSKVRASPIRNGETMAIT